MKIAVIAPTRYPISQPYAGGMESFCALLVQGLRDSGHHVDLYAARGSDGHVREFEFPGVNWTGLEATATDDTYPPGHSDKEDRTVTRLLHHLVEQDYDIVHNNSLHPSVFNFGAQLPLLTTLHCPPVTAMQQAILAAGPDAGRFAAVSHTTANQWELPRWPAVVPNAFDHRTFRLGPGGGGAVWFGRLIRDKGPHLAIDAARRAGLPLTLFGQRRELEYWRRELAPRDAADLTWMGGCTHQEVAAVLRRSSVCLVTPTWDEPFGLVTIEAMACGTPVAAFARGGVAEILDGAPGRLVSPGDVDALAAAALEAGTLDRTEVAAYTAANYGLPSLVQQYLGLYQQVEKAVL